MAHEQTHDEDMGKIIKAFWLPKPGSHEFLEKGRVALVGDAAYCPSPAVGMGGSVAILGAAALGEAFKGHPDDFDAAFREYDTSFRPVVEAIQTQAVSSDRRCSCRARKSHPEAERTARSRQSSNLCQYSYAPLWEVE